MEGLPGFDVRAVAIEAGEVHTYDEAEWRDALVVVARGEIELEPIQGDPCLLECGAVLCLVGLPLRGLRSRGTEPTVLIAFSRR
jgi:hypothetical protein